MPRQRGAAADDQADAPPEPLLELREDELVEEGGGAGELDAVPQGPQLAPEPPVEEQGLDASRLCDFGGGPGVDPVEDPRDPKEEGGAEGSDVVDEVLDVAFSFFFCAEGDREGEREREREKRVEGKG